jgi:hypothetical protein
MTYRRPDTPEPGARSSCASSSSDSRSPGRLEVDLVPLLRVVDLARLLNCSRREVERMRAAGRVPRPDLYVGLRSPRWRPEVIHRWIEGRGL